MNIDSVVSSISLTTIFYILFYIAKKAHDFLHKYYNLVEELVDRDNPAMALAIVGYYAAVVIGVGGSLIGPSFGLVQDIIDLVVYGLLSIILLNISWFVCDKLILYKFKMEEELIRDRNQGTGAVSFGISVATGFIIFGAVSGEGGNIWTAVIFWGIGQIILIMAGFVYNFIISYDLHEQIEKDNVAAGVSFGGALISIGIIVGVAAEGDFYSWSTDISWFIFMAVVGLMLLPIIRIITDKLLLPTVNLSDEIIGLKRDKTKEAMGPNVGAAYIEAFSYIAAACIICWCI